MDQEYAQWMALLHSSYEDETSLIISYLHELSSVYTHKAVEEKYLELERHKDLMPQSKNIIDTLITHCKNNPLYAHELLEQLLYMRQTDCKKTIEALVTTFLEHNKDKQVFNWDWLHNELSWSQWLFTYQFPWETSQAAKNIKRYLDFLNEKISSQLLGGSDYVQAKKNTLLTKNNGQDILWAIIRPPALTMSDVDAYLYDCHSALDNWHNKTSCDLNITFSNLYPRIEPLQLSQALPVIIPALQGLIAKAHVLNVSLILDAGLSTELPLMLSVLKTLLHASTLSEYNLFGVTVQAYNPAAPKIIQEIAAWARKNESKISIRLVKGSYCKEEIALARKMNTRPAVYSQKAYTDIAYIYCTTILRNQLDVIHPIFATSALDTIAHILVIMKLSTRYTFQFYFGTDPSMPTMLLLHSGGALRTAILTPIGQAGDLGPYIDKRLTEIMRKDKPYQITHLDYRKQAEETLTHCPKTQQIMPLPLSMQTLTHSIKVQQDSLEKNTTILQSYITSFPLPKSTWHQLSYLDRHSLLQKLLDSLEHKSEAWVSLLIVEGGLSWHNAIKEVYTLFSVLRSCLNEAHTLTPCSPTLHPRLCLVYTDTVQLALILESIFKALLAGHTLILAHCTLPETLENLQVFLEKNGLPPHTLLSYYTQHNVEHFLATFPDIRSVTEISRAFSTHTYPPHVLHLHISPSHCVLISDASLKPEAIIRTVVEGAFIDRTLSVWLCPEDLFEDYSPLLAKRMALINIASKNLASIDIGPLSPTEHADYNTHATWCQEHAELISYCPVHTSGEHLISATAYKLTDLPASLPVNIPLLYVVVYNSHNRDNILHKLGDYGLPINLTVASIHPDFMAELAQHTHASLSKDTPPSKHALFRNYYRGLLPSSLNPYDSQ